MDGPKLLVLAFILQVAQSNEVSEEGQFRQLSGDNACICPDRSWSMTYECTVVGGFITIWKGSAISSLCEDSRSGIFLLHNRFVDHPILCDNGTIVGKGVKVENNSYTSELTVIVSSNSSILGESVVCAQSRNGTTLVVGNTTIELQNLIDHKVYISAIDIGLRQLEFTWSPVALGCPTVHYIILASNCGSCPTTTNDTNVTCSGVPTNGSMCIFVVQPVVCGDTNGASNYSLITNSTQIFKGTHSKYDSLSFLIVGIACLTISVSLTILCCCLYMLSKRNTTDSRAKGITNYNTTSPQKESNTTRREHHTDNNCDYSELEEIPLDLKSLLKKLQGQVSKQWYQFGLALGLPMDVLEEFNHYSEDDCLFEVLDYWLKHHPAQPTWQEITDARSKIETFNTPKVSGTVKRERVDKEDASDIPPPKPPRRSSSVTARNSTAPPSTESNIECEHEYESLQ